MKEYNWLLLVTLVVSVASAQKLFFKSNKLIQEEIEQHLQKAQPVKGFGFVEPRQYFTSHRKTENALSKVSDNVVVCPDNKTACPEGNTCCLTSPVGYGCCPLPMASCCPDKKHCCPTRTQCDQIRQACISGVVAIPWYEKTAGINLDSEPVKDRNSHKVEVVICPDGEHECQDGQTCCKSAEEYSCCPLPHEVCKVIAQVESVICPDGEHQCGDGQTCCRSREGYSCCPIPNAVCCSDEVHCCPTNTTCDVSHGRCNKGSTGEFLDWVKKVPKQKVKSQSSSNMLVPVNTARQSLIGSVQCDDKHVCPTGNTCCKMVNNDWGCCPKPEAECCDDKLHCCPKGSKCEATSGSCVQGQEKMTWLEKQPAVALEVVKCDERHECPTGNTCCKLSSGQWGCCPLPKAVCCSDGVHCCPDGTTCDVSSGKCNRGNIQLDWFVKQPAIEVENVRCDSSHECPSGNTCCKLSSGQWGCCPLPNAVCCSDGVHCCPGGTTCDVSSGKCNHAGKLTDWFAKQPAIEVENVRCDSSHECPTGNTCCKLSSGQWGCCPLPNAVCCSDGVHCCPGGTSCDVSSGKCNHAGVLTDWFVKQPAIEVENVRCDSSHECPSGNTCCKLSSGQWGCCPLPNAVCCSDGVHCCPGGTTCDVSSGKCNHAGVLTDWFVKQPAIEVENVPCDSSHECPSGNTCCKLSSGQWGCCPLPNAVCCSDGVHCCPGGTTCDVSSGKCNHAGVLTDWFVKQPAIEVENVRCDSSHECPSGNTCCKLSSGQWGCCPLPNAVCCSDGVHCCPGGTTCDVSSGKCNHAGELTDWFVKQPAIKVENVRCDSSHECPSGNTCCKLSSGQWGCCPLPNAVCCGDGVHCCPGGTTCDVSSGKCNHAGVLTDWFVKQPAIEVENVRCDSSHECPSGNTCCKLSSGQWGCCPLPNAVCCSDGVHCCPGGTTCDVSSGKCNHAGVLTDWFVKQPAIEVENVRCDSSHECPSGNTCCKLSSGQWGCCPLPNAVCCSDGVHCCPGGTTCDVSSGKCNHAGELTDWFVKQPAIEVENVRCDSSHECPSGNTCCKLSSGQWGCCPLPNAVCCSDGVHCCPGGTSCDVSSGKCNHAGVLTDWFVKQPAIEVENVRCDSSHECPSGNTCCKLSSGQWGCCPLPNAICCSDGVHCCPGGTTCDVSSGKCNHAGILTDWFVKQPAIEVENVRCDSSHECPTGNTCCKLSSGQWGCCPLPKAVCCSDGVHCCPDGTTCDVSTGKCNRGNIQLDWFVKTSAVKSIQDVICPDGSECQDGQTCCEMSNGVKSYGCCPLPNAVCCNDGQHCCPHTYRCDLSAGACIRGMIKLPWIRTNRHHDNTLDIQEIKNIENTILDKKRNLKLHDSEVQCTDGTKCPDGNSCCENGKGGYNCCPMPNGICCDDHQHCCPHGYICDEEPGICRIPEINAAASNFIRKLGSKRGAPLS